MLNTGFLLFNQALIASAAAGVIVRPTSSCTTTTSSSCTTGSSGIPTPSPVDPYQKCSDDHGGQSTWSDPDKICKCETDGSITCV
ncbi:hypothetical protein BB559_002179 [Furculomyces boomerangus]|uniref:Uncharacterized protein n=2 Tax=Harpellales TaxID=61421 RepID=A0A2T9YXB8_9FUNG|nr:hypothetical protein BB559_002179 [Furculomyces boomerangus]PWA02046.1 hypothetical protein BB558_001827 [Smittium angustum]